MPPSKKQKQKTFSPQKYNTTGNVHAKDTGKNPYVNINQPFCN